MFHQCIKTMIIALFVIVLSGSAFAFSDSDLNELLAKIDSAAATRDASQIAHLLSDGASIVVEMPTPQGSMKLELNKQQYLELTQQGWNAIGPSYKYTRLSTEIESDGTKAQVVSIVREEFEAGEQTISSDTLEIADFEEEDGRLVVVKVVAQARVQIEPMPKPSI